MIACASVPPDVHDFFCRNLDRAAERRRTRQRESLLREEAAAEGNTIHEIDSDNDEELQRALHASGEEEAYASRVRE